MLRDELGFVCVGIEMQTSGIDQDKSFGVSSWAMNGMALLTGSY